MEKIKGISIEAINKMNYVATMDEVIDVATDTFIQSLNVIYDNIPEEDLNLMKIYYKRRLIKNIVDNCKY